MLSHPSLSVLGPTNGSSDLRTFFDYIREVGISIYRICRGPTALDALIFAYLHCILHTKDNAIRVEVTRRVNLVAWEHRVSSQVRMGFRRSNRVVQ